MAKQSTRNKELTPAQDALQKERGLLYRQILGEAAADMLEPTKNPAIFLSGGIDSNSTLWSMLDAGARPGVITYHIPTAPKRSKDSVLAERLARHYDLPFHLVIINDDADYVATQMKEIITRAPNLESRADLEVLYLFWEMMKGAAEFGYDSVFSGICDGQIHMLGRKNEIMGRGGQMPTPLSDNLRIVYTNDDQFWALNELALSEGLAFFNPLRMTCFQFPYNDLEWELLNTPRNKEITRRAYAKEIEETKAQILVQPLQCGDTGAREFFDSKLSESKAAREIAGREITSSKMYINSLVKQAEEAIGFVAPVGPRKKTVAYGALFNKRVNGTPIPEGWQGEYEYDEDGYALNPPEVEDDGLFGEIEDEGAEKVHLHPETGLPDTRTDCYGTPFWKGDVAWNGCARAQAGLCGKKPDPEYDYTKCEQFDVRSEELLGELQTIIDINEKYDSIAVKPYQKWYDRSAATYEALKAREGRPVRV